MPNPTLATAPTVAGLTARLKAGEAVSPDELVRAEAAERLDRLRADAATEAAAERAETGRRDRIAALADGIPADLDPAPIAAARDDLAAALDRFVGVCRAHGLRFAAALDALGDGSLAPLPPGLLAEGVNVRTVHAGGRTFRIAPTQRTIREAATEAIARHYGPRQTVSLDRPRD